MVPEPQSIGLFPFIQSVHVLHCPSQSYKYSKKWHWVLFSMVLKTQYCVKSFQYHSIPVSFPVFLGNMEFHACLWNKNPESSPRHRKIAMKIKYRHFPFCLRLPSSGLTRAVIVGWWIIVCRLWTLGEGLRTALDAVLELWLFNKGSAMSEHWKLKN